MGYLPLMCLEGAHQVIAVDLGTVDSGKRSSEERAWRYEIETVGQTRTVGFRASVCIRLPRELVAQLIEGCFVAPIALRLLPRFEPGPHFIFEHMFESKRRV